MKTVSLATLPLPLLWLLLRTGSLTSAWSPATPSRRAAFTLTSRALGVTRSALRAMTLPFPTGSNATTTGVSPSDNDGESSTAESTLTMTWTSTTTTTTTTDAALHTTGSRFDRAAATHAASEQECILEIHGQRYNLTAWAKAHPGGVNVLYKFHNGKGDATRAFERADHSAAAYEMLKEFWIGPVLTAVDDAEGGKAHVAVVPPGDARTERPSGYATTSHGPSISDTSALSRARTPTETTTTTVSTLAQLPAGARRKRPRWIQKLFTKEDPVGIHKYMGIFCLLHFILRFAQMLGGDPSAGFGTRRGRGPHVGPALCLVPHAILSLSSLIFHTVPRERVVGKPMIWQEYRIHNIAFGMRSVLCTALAWLSVYKHHATPFRRLAVVGSCATALLANVVADWGTHRFRINNAESTTATMPYWEGCSMKTQKRFKRFYAYAQFMATLACIAVCNPAWSLAVLLAIQTASLFMTLTRKGLMTARGYHLAYTATLILPFFVGIRSNLYMQPWAFPSMMALGGGLFWLRSRGMNKYAIWIPVYAVRIALGERFFLPNNVW